MNNDPFGRPHPFIPSLTTFSSHTHAGVEKNRRYSLEKYMHQCMLDLALAYDDTVGSKSLLRSFRSSLIQTMMEHPLKTDDSLLFALDYTVKLLLKDAHSSPQSKFLRVEASRRESVILKTIQKDFSYGLDLYQQTQDEIIPLVQSRDVMPHFSGVEPVDVAVFSDDEDEDMLGTTQLSVQPPFQLQQGEYGIQGDLFEGK